MTSADEPLSQRGQHQSPLTTSPGKAIMSGARDTSLGGDNGGGSHPGLAAQLVREEAVCPRNDVELFRRGKCSPRLLDLNSNVFFPTLVEWELAPPSSVERKVADGLISDVDLLVGKLRPGPEISKR